MRPFEYLEPANLDQACHLLSEYKDKAKILAGGQGLLPILKQRLINPGYLISIKNLHELEYIRENRAGIEIGALTTHRSIETSSLIREQFPMLVDMERILGSIQVRNWGTIGGNLCHADPGSDPGPALIAFKAKVKAASLRGIREIPLESFFVSFLETALEPDEILTEINIPYPSPHTGLSYVKESVKFGGRTIASIAVSITMSGKHIREARIVLGAVGNKPFRATETEKFLYNMESSQILEKAAEIAAEEVEPRSDLEGTKEYKKQIVKVITKKVLGWAILQAQNQNREGAK